MAVLVVRGGRMGNSFDPGMGGRRVQDRGNHKDARKVTSLAGLPASQGQRTPLALGAHTERLGGPR